MVIPIEINDITGEYRTKQIKARGVCGGVDYAIYEDYNCTIVELDNKSFEFSVVDIVKALVEELK